MWEPDPPSPSEDPESSREESTRSEPVQSALRLSLFWTCIACLVAVFVLWFLLVTAPKASAQGVSTTSSGAWIPASCIQVLFPWCRPADVSRFIIPPRIRVAVDRMFWRRLRTHIGEECDKVIHPS